MYVYKKKGPEARMSVCRPVFTAATQGSIGCIRTFLTYLTQSDAEEFKRPNLICQGRTLWLAA